MKSSKLLFTSLASLSFAVTLFVNATIAQTDNSAKPVMQTLEVPRIYGTFTEGLVSEVAYKPAACPAFVFDIDAVALQNSTSRAYAEAESAKLPALKARWDKYENCLVKNAKLDSELLFEKLKNSFAAPNDIEIAAFNKVFAAVNPARERIAADTKKKKNVNIVEPDFVSTWKDPTGRILGKLSKGSADSIVYTSGCPVYLGEVSVEHLQNAKTPKLYQQLADIINATDQRRAATLKCRNDNTGPDYNEVAKSIQAGFDVVYKETAREYNRKIAILEKVIEVAKKPGGTLAPIGKPSVKPVAKPVTKPAAKPAAKKTN